MIFLLTLTIPTYLGFLYFNWQPSLHACLQGWTSNDRSDIHSLKTDVLRLVCPWALTVLK